MNKLKVGDRVVRPEPPFMTGEVIEVYTSGHIRIRLDKTIWNVGQPVILGHPDSWWFIRKEKD